MPAVLGYSTQGGSAGQLAHMYGCVFTTVEGGAVQNIQVYARHDFGGGDSINVAVYADSSGNPGALLFQSTTSYLAPDGNVNLVTFRSFTGTPTLSANTPYWITLWTNTDSVFSFFYDAGAVGQLKQSTTNGTFPTYQTPFGAINATTNNKMSIWINYKTDTELHKIFVRQTVRPALFKPGNSR